jgi:hypothetical protein
MDVPSSKLSFQNLLKIFRDPTIRDIDFSHWYNYIYLIVSEWESLVEEFPEDSVFQIKFFGVKKFSIQYNFNDTLTDNCNVDNKETFDFPRGFNPGWIKNFSKESINGKNCYCITTSAKGYDSPALEIYFDDVEIAFLGTKKDIDRIEKGNLLLSSKGKAKILWKKEIEK